MLFTSPEGKERYGVRRTATAFVATIALLGTAERASEKDVLKMFAETGGRIASIVTSPEQIGSIVIDRVSGGDNPGCVGVVKTYIDEGETYDDLASQLNPSGNLNTQAITLGVMDLNNGKELKAGDTAATYAFCPE